jgi:hypothetical protein
LELTLTRRLQRYYPPGATPEERTDLRPGRYGGRVGKENADRLWLKWNSTQLGKAAVARVQAAVKGAQELAGKPEPGRDERSAAFCRLAGAALALHDIGPYWSAHFARSVFCALCLRCADEWGVLAKMPAADELGAWLDYPPSGEYAVTPRAGIVHFDVTLCIEETC